MNRFVILMLFAILAGCGGNPNPTEEMSPAQAKKTDIAPPSEPKSQANNPPKVAAKPSPSQTVTIKPLSLGGLGGGSQTQDTGKSSVGDKAMDSVLEAMQPLQVFLGQWNTTTQNMGAGSLTWVWDFKTDKSQPALVMSAKNHPYFESARLTFLTGDQKFQITAVDKDKNKRTYQGKFTEDPHLVTGDGGKPEPRFEMMLNEVDSGEARKLVGVKLTQRNRDRMWMQVFQKSGKTLRLQDNVASQRQGTSFAASDMDYGEKECIVSQGLGTITVSYMGRTYYVCCSGCQAAFNDDPTFWIDKAEERKKAKK